LATTNAGDQIPVPLHCFGEQCIVCRKYFKHNIQTNDSKTALNSFNFS